MQNIHSLATKALAKGQTTSSAPLEKSQRKALDLSSKNSTPIEWVTTLFAALQGIYGDKWTRNIPVAKNDLLIVIQMWQSALVGCTKEEIQEAVSFLNSPANNIRDRAPTTFEFVDICRMKRKPLESLQVKIHYVKPSEQSFLEYQASLALIPGFGAKYIKSFAKEDPERFKKIIEIVRNKDAQYAKRMEGML